MRLELNRIMKKTLVLVLLVSLVFTFAGCEDKNVEPVDDVEETLYAVINTLLREDFLDDLELTPEQQAAQRDLIVQATVDSILASSEDDFVFYEVLNDIVSDHYSQTEREALMLGAIEGAITSLDDPYTRYFDLEEAQQYQSNFGETYVGIGVTVRFEDGQIVIEVVKSDGPADLAGLRVGDIITHVDGEGVSNESYYETINRILGEEDTDVTIGVYRPGQSDTLYFTMTRALIENPTVEYEIFEQEGQKVGYIQVTTFGDETALNFQAAVINLENQGIDSLIVDLRNNGGGHLSTVINMLNVFLVNDGTHMFSTESYNDNELYINRYVASNTERKSYNIVTLVNEHSASASEVFASSMKEHGGYPVIGVQTFGKGTMQTTAPIITTFGDYLHLTIGKWKTADGNWVHYDGGTDGVTPTVTVEMTAIENAYKVFLLDESAIMYDTVDTRVANIQVVLNMMGYTVRTDGYYDMATKEAIEDIQTINSLPVTGNMDQETLEVINDVLFTYLSDPMNDTQLQASVLYLLDNPGDPNE